MRTETQSLVAKLWMCVGRDMYFPGSSKPAKIVEVFVSESYEGQALTDPLGCICVRVDLNEVDDYGLNMFLTVDNWHDDGPPGTPFIPLRSLNDISVDEVKELISYCFGEEIVENVSLDLRYRKSLFVVDFGPRNRRYRLSVSPMKISFERLIDRDQAVGEAVPGWVSSWLIEHGFDYMGLLETRFGKEVEL